MCEVCNNTGVVNTLIGNVTFPVACSACCVTEPEPPKKPEPVCKTDENGTKRWYLEGQLHRADGPAVERADGSKRWYFEDKLHRADGPAVEMANGYKAWYLEDKRHRADGPAVEWADGDKHWYVEGKLHRAYGPAIELADGTKEWYLNGKKVTEKDVMKRKGRVK